MLASLLMSPPLLAQRLNAGWKSLWESDFGPGVCYLTMQYWPESYDDSGFIYLNFVTVTDKAQVDREFGKDSAWQAFLKQGVRDGELLVDVDSPGPEWFEGSSRPASSVVSSVSIDSIDAPYLETPKSKELSNYKMNRFVIREPESKVLLEKLKSGQDLNFVLGFSDDTVVKLTYTVENMQFFRVRLAQFHACIKSMSPNKSSEQPPAAGAPDGGR